MEFLFGIRVNVVKQTQLVGKERKISEPFVVEQIAQIQSCVTWTGGHYSELIFQCGVCHYFRTILIAESN